MQIEAHFVSDVLRGDDTTEMRVSLVRYIEDEMPPDEEWSEVEHWNGALLDYQGVWCSGFMQFESFHAHAITTMVK